MGPVVRLKALLLQSACVAEVWEKNLVILSSLGMYGGGMMSVIR